jgi:uncharacterized membrane protein YgcG
MNRKKFIPIIIVVVVAVMAMVGVTAFRTVQAAVPATASLNGLNIGHGMMGGATDQELATALGIDLTKLQAAYTTATSDALAQAVSTGQITQSQADQLKANGGRFNNFGPFQITGIDYNALLAKALGITTDKLQAAYITAYNTAIDSQVTSGKLTQTQADLMKGEYAFYNNTKYQTAMQTAFQTAVSQAVTDGVITQSQADQILKNNSGTNFGEFGGRGGSGGFGGDPGGFGGGRGKFGGGPGGRGGHGQNGTTNPGTTSPAAPTATPNGL